MLSFSLLVLSILPRLDRPVCESVDLVEVNHRYDENTAKWLLDQVIFYDWSHRDARFMVLDFRVVRNGGQYGYAASIPVREWPSGQYHSLWLEYGTMRSVTAQHFRETWTMSDPEVGEREFLPKDRRRELRKWR